MSDVNVAERPVTQQPADAGRALSPIAAIKHGLEQMRPQFRVALPSHITPEKFERTVLTALNVNPDLAMADRRSLFNACTRAAQDGLLPDGREGALVIFKDKNGKQNIQWLPMVYGLIKKARQSGEIAKIGAELVYEHDEFEVNLGDQERFTHKPNYRAADRGKVQLVYAYVVFKDGAVQREVLTIKDVEKARAVSKAGKSEYGPWTKWWEEMARKTALRRLSKYLPLSSELQQAFNRDDEPTDYENRRKSALQDLSEAGRQMAALPPADEPHDPETGEIIDAETIEADDVASDVDELATEYLPAKVSDLVTMDVLADLEELNENVRKVLAGRDDLLGEWANAYLTRKRELSNLKTTKKAT